MMQSFWLLLLLYGSCSRTLFDELAKEGSIYLSRKDDQIRSAKYAEVAPDGVDTVLSLVPAKIMSRSMSKPWGRASPCCLVVSKMH